MDLSSHKFHDDREERGQGSLISETATGFRRVLGCTRTRKIGHAKIMPQKNDPAKRPNVVMLARPIMIRDRLVHCAISRMTKTKASARHGIANHAAKGWMARLSGNGLAHCMVRPGTDRPEAGDARKDQRDPGQKAAEDARGSITLKKSRASQAARNSAPICSDACRPQSAPEVNVVRPGVLPRADMRDDDLNDKKIEGRGHQRRA